MRTAPNPGSTSTAPTCTVSVCQAPANSRAQNAPSWLLRTDAAAGHVGGPRAAVGRHVSGVAAVDRPPPRCADVASAAYDLGLSGRLRLRAGFLWSAVRSPRPAACSDGGARHLSPGDGGLRVVILH